ncbi:MAG: Cof-type HAD-IIB family hydrolase [Microlunatus sp.]|nr:Cof-type HAD-IIB family hydrolase [Microlunatus sp.]
MGPSENWRPKVVALDVDGTVVDHDGSLPKQVRAAVRAAVTGGARVVLSTGRSWHGTLPVVQELGLPPGPSVCSNGAVVVDFPPERIVHAVTFDPRAVIEKVESYAPGTLIAVEEIGRGYRMNGQFPTGDLTGEQTVEDVEELSARPVTRIILRDPGRSDTDFIGLAERLGLHALTYYVGYSAWLDIGPEGVSKASGLDQVVGDLGVGAADVLAVGDGRNDAEMLAWAGRGVAMGQAPLEIRQLADAVTGTFAEGGLVSELRRWF